jgi:hypothetical protein
MYVTARERQGTNVSLARRVMRLGSIRVGTFAYLLENILDNIRAHFNLGLRRIEFT